MTDIIHLSEAWRGRSAACASLAEAVSGWAAEFEIERILRATGVDIPPLQGNDR